MGGGLEIIFTDIEALINELINKHELWVGTKSGPVTDLDTTFRDKDSNEPYQINWRKRLTACEIATEEDVKEFCYLLQNYIREYVINWFKEYQNLDVLNNYMKTVPDFDSFFSFGNYHIFRKLIIKKSCNDNSYNDYFLHWKTRLEELNREKDNKYLKDYNALIELESILKNW